MKYEEVKSDVFCEGEYDMLYVVDGTYKFNKKTLNKIRKTDPDYEADADDS